MKLILLILSLLSSTCYAQITQAATMKDVMNIFQEVHPETLTLFDIDMVLIQPKDPAFQMPNMKRFGSIAKRIVQSIPDEKERSFWSLQS